MRERDREMFSIYQFSPQILTTAGAVAQSQELLIPSSLPCGRQGPKHLSHYLLFPRCIDRVMGTQIGIPVGGLTQYTISLLSRIWILKS